MRSGKYYAGRLVDGVKRDIHRIIAEEYLGRELEPGEVVHHIDGNINNNHHSNLLVMSRSAHTRLHRAGSHIPKESRERISQSLMGKPNVACRKLTLKNVEFILTQKQQGKSDKEIALALGVGKTTVFSVVHGDTYKDCVAKIKSKS